MTSVIHVRNIRDSTLYHLTFQGSVAGLTGLQLRRYLEDSTGIRADDQYLTFNGLSFGPRVLAGDLGVTNQSVVVLDVLDGAWRDRYEELSPNDIGRSPSPQVDCERPLQGAEEGDDEGVRGGGGTENVTIKESNRAESLSGNVKSPRPDNRVDIQVLDESAVGADDVNSYQGGVGDSRGEACADLLECQLQDKDYQWKLQQIKFETDRMVRESELARMKEELTYESMRLDRQLSQLEMNTRVVRAKRIEIQRELERDIALEAQIRGCPIESTDVR